MKKHALLILALLLLQGQRVVGQITSEPMLPAAVQVQVLDEDGKPISGEEVEVDYLVVKAATNYKQEFKKGKSDQGGIFQAEFETNMDAIGCKVGGKEGYYSSICAITPTNSRRKAKQWNPWNPVIKLPLRKKINPVPMFVKKANPIVEKKIPRDAQLKFPDEVAYDLEKGDYCAPQGKGIVKDLIFKVDRSRSGAVPVVKLLFTNKEDGVVRLDPKDPKNCIPPKGERFFRYDYGFEGPRNAPSNGYASLTWDNLPSRENVYYMPMEKERESFYIFRVRSQADESGNITSARYGKIKGGFSFAVNKDGFVNIIFLYYYNPDGTPNLEWDIKRNLHPDSNPILGFPRVP